MQWHVFVTLPIQNSITLSVALTLHVDYQNYETNFTNDGLKCMTSMALYGTFCCCCCCCSECFKKFSLWLKPISLHSFNWCAAHVIQCNKFKMCKLKASKFTNRDHSYGNLKTLSQQLICHKRQSGTGCGRSEFETFHQNRPSHVRHIFVYKTSYFGWK